jgi:glycerol-3-phosphate acyltransferase PlsY
VLAAIVLSRSAVLGYAYSNVPWRLNYPGTPAPSIVATSAAVAALFAILGHVFPVWLRFRGGKGVATAVGAFSLLAPSAIFAAVALFLLVAFLSRYISLSSLIAAASFPILTWLFYRHEFPGSVMFVISIASCVIIVRHYQNIRRLLAGTEPRFQLRYK